MAGWRGKYGFYRLLRNLYSATGKLLLGNWQLQVLRTEHENIHRQLRIVLYVLFKSLIIKALE